MLQESFKPENLFETGRKRTIILGLLLAVKANILFALTGSVLITIAVGIGVFLK